MSATRISRDGSIVAIVAALRSTAPRLSHRASSAAVLLVLVVTALGIAASSGIGPFGSGKAVSGVLHAASNKVGEALRGVDIVAAMLSDRSPGERPGGALASLKHKRAAALHERALPKIRSAPPVSPLATIVAAPPVPPAIAPPVPGPLYNTVAAAPPIATAVGQKSPIIFPAMAPPPGGGLIVPPTVAQVTPLVPGEVATPPAVPEPSTWAMMFVGFGLIGWTLRRGARPRHSVG